jgi:endonuclease YncB( thermonuclease family)
MFFGTEAADFASDALEGRSVRLELLADSTRDRHGRLLAYVYPSGWQDSLNERLIEQGFGYADWRFPHVYRTRYNEVEARARRRRRGLWASVRPDQTPRWRQRMIARSSRKTKTENSSD